jgi:hypothetical protein
MSNILKWLGEHEYALLLVLLVLFLSVRLPGVHLPLHQDEYKWPIIVNPATSVGVSIPHPPVGEFIYRTAGYIVGFNVNFRLVPLFFGTINLLLLYYLVRIMFGKKEAMVASLIWIFSYFSVLASLMVDTDGEIMPFFFLLALISYFKLKNSTGRHIYLWSTILLVSCVIGFLVKVSFILAIGAILADFLWSKKDLISKKEFLKYIAYLLALLGFFVLVLIVSKFIFPFFNLSKSIVYWEHFFTLNRGWLQTFIQCVKAVLYSSPLLILIPFFSEKSIISRAKVFIFFLIFSFIFYVLLFDFSLGALDRYLQLLILPLSVLTAATIVEITRTGDKRSKEFLLLGIAVSVVLVLLGSLPHFVPPLHPKTEWISRIIHMKWNFLYPFSGGSGPLGFYVSFLFMGATWIISFLVVIFSKIKLEYEKLALLFILPIAITYNGIFIEEYLVGHFNGYAPGLLSKAVQFIKEDKDIKMVTVYNDNGGYDVQQTGKYRKRLYVDPKFDINEKIATLNMYKEHYFVLDVPRIDPSSVYQKYFDSCKIIYHDVDKKMSATIYDCRSAPDIKN